MREALLLVDDDEDFREWMQSHLESRGYECVGAGTAADAWSLTRERYFPVILLDWLLPDEDGVSLCARLRRQPGHERYTYIIMVTVRSSRDEIIRGLDSGADDVLGKPVDETLLQVRLKVAQRVLRLQTDVANLRQLVSMCSLCNKVRDEAGRWKRIEEYLEGRTGTSVSHGYCPECFSFLMEKRRE